MKKEKKENYWLANEKKQDPTNWVKPSLNFVCQPFKMMLRHWKRIMEMAHEKYYFKKCLNNIS